MLEGEHFQSYYVFYGSLFFALIYVSAFRWGFEKVSGVILRAAGYRRRAVLVGSGSNIQAVAHALRDSREIEPFGFVARTPVALMDGLRDFRSLEQLERHFDAIDEVLIADADFPEEEAVELVDRCHQQGVRVRVAPSTMEILMERVEYVPGQALPLFELKPPVFEGVDFALKRTFDLVGAALLVLVLSPVMLARRARHQAHLARPDLLPLAPARDRREVLPVHQVPHDGRGRRGAPGPARGAQRGGRRALQDARRPARDHGRPLPAALVARRAAAALQRAPRRDVARRPPAASAARLRPARRLAPQALPRAARA